jgi:shikimate dehydrogenase
MAEKKDYQLGLIGWPVEHSYSPAMHQAALAHNGLGGDYRLYPIPPLPEGKPALREIIQQVKSAVIDGLNVTIPHKQNVITLLDELSPAAEAIGAVNTIFLEKNQLKGDNTDAAGFMNDLKHFFSDHGLDVSGKKALVLGAGGAARAVCYALHNQAWQVTVAARRLSQAEQLAALFSLNAAIETSTYALAKQEPALIVNATPLGMHPNVNTCPWPDDLPLPERAAVYDLVYNPRETLLVQRARLQGLPAISGLGMLAEQAALSFKIWTSRVVPRQVMLDALEPENLLKES